MTNNAGFMRTRFRIPITIGLLVILAACTTVGPEFVKPQVELPDDWSGTGENGLESSAIKQPQWWRVLNDPVLNQLVETAWRQNNSLEIAGLRVLEARAQLGMLSCFAVIFAASAGIECPSS